MLTKQEFLDKIIEKNPKYDTELIGKAFDVAEAQHAGQLRKSGEPYLIHPINVALILAELGMDDNTICGGLLHDVIEDTGYTDNDMIRDFGKEVLVLVEGVTKLGSIKFESKEEIQAENFRKMFLAMSKDIRVLIIKLADRLHNMRTMEYMKPEKILEKCRETLEIYSPLAGRLGMYRIKFELEDSALRYLHPAEFEDLVKKVSQRTHERESTINAVIAEIKKSLDEMHMKYEIYGRAKHYYSIYRKMLNQHKTIDELFDLIAVRVIVDSVRDCYAALGAVHTMWTPIPGRFKDFIAMPKPNMYQSLHTTVIGENAEPFEIQIRTKEMHQVAEYGIAAHWKYKEGTANGSASPEDVKLAWLRQSLELEKDVTDPKEFLESMKVDLFASQVFVFTPRGEVIELPNGSTPLDFAFKIHSAVGYKCVGAKVNNKMVPIDYNLNNGDIVEIVTSSNASGPSIDWLLIAKTSGARNKIRQWLKKENKSDTVDKGKDALDKAVRKKGYDSAVICKSEFISRAMKEMKFTNNDEGFTQLANGGSVLSKFANLLISYYEEKVASDAPKSNDEIIDSIRDQEIKKQRIERHRKDNPGISVKGYDNLMIKIARCCNPVPGDEIIGFITKGRGISVHRYDCSNILALPESEKVRFIDVEWDKSGSSKTYITDINIICKDRKGVLSDISRVCDDLDVNLSGVNARVDEDGIANMTITLAISSTQQMEKVFLGLRSVPGVIDVFRARA